MEYNIHEKFLKLIQLFENVFNFSKNRRMNTKKRIMHLQFFTSFLFVLIDYVFLSSIWLSIYSTQLLQSVNQNFTGFYQFPTCLEFLESDITLKYFDPEMAKDCALCKFTSNNDISDSTKKDVIITYSSLKTMNIALLQRTLRK